MADACSEICPKLRDLEYRLYCANLDLEFLEEKEAMITDLTSDFIDAAQSEGLGERTLEDLQALELKDKIDIFESTAKAAEEKAEAETEVSKFNDEIIPSCKGPFYRKKLLLFGEMQIRCGADD